MAPYLEVANGTPLIQACRNKSKDCPYAADTSANMLQRRPHHKKTGCEESSHQTHRDLEGVVLSTSSLLFRLKLQSPPNLMTSAHSGQRWAQKSPTAFPQLHCDLRANNANQVSVNECCLDLRTLDEQIPWTINKNSQVQMDGLTHKLAEREYLWQCSSCPCQRQTCQNDLSDAKWGCRKPPRTKCQKMERVFGSLATFWERPCTHAHSSMCGTMHSDNGQIIFSATGKVHADLKTTFSEKLDAKKYERNAFGKIALCCVLSRHKWNTPWDQASRANISYQLCLLSSPR